MQKPNNPTTALACGVPALLLGLAVAAAARGEPPGEALGEPLGEALGEALLRAASAPRMGVRPGPPVLGRLNCCILQATQRIRGGKLHDSPTSERAAGWSSGRLHMPLHKSLPASQAPNHTPRLDRGRGRPWRACSPLHRPGGAQAHASGG